jgi:hypothetical protein
MLLHSGVLTVTTISVVSLLFLLHATSWRHAAAATILDVNKGGGSSDTPRWVSEEMALERKAIEMEENIIKMHRVLLGLVAFVAIILLIDIVIKLQHHWEHLDKRKNQKKKLYCCT